jgi:UDP-N-acetylmuramyl tripeptide synthase
LAGALSRAAGRGGGTTLPGHVFLRLAPAGVDQLATQFAEGIAVISATNGKTTTAAMLSHVLGADRTVCRNGAGANLMTGVVATLLARPDDADVAVLEVDEAALPAVAAAVQPQVVALGNLFRDQLDRHGELELVADRWRSLTRGLPPAVTLVLGADDPVIDALGDGRSHVVRYGIDDPTVALAQRDAAADSTFCVRCGAAYTYDEVYLGHLGAYRCPAGDHARGALTIAARALETDGANGTRFRIDAPDGSSAVSLPLPGLYNVENALAAIATAYVLGVPTATAASRLGDFRAAFGRFERIDVAGREVVLILFKNPTGANEALRAIAPDLPGAHVVLALNDRIADGRDVSWIWDIDLENRFGTVASIVCTGTRAEDLAVRLRYAGVAIEQIDRLRDVASGLDGAVANAAPGERIYVLATYTAMLDLHRVLAERGLTEPFWEGGR